MMVCFLFTACLANVVLRVSSTDTCIPPDKCGGRDNEHWVDCPLDCLPKNCSQLGFPVPCPIYGPHQNCPVAPGCVCNEGYLRNDKGICVLKKQCPKCAGDPNAESGCGNCQKTCSNYNNTKPQICNKSCDLNGCNCKKGFILDEYTKKCVRPEDCTCKGDVNAKPGCGQNCGRRCSNYDQGPVACPAICEVNGCDCKDGYVYDDYINKCVLPEKCSKCGGRDNEHWVNCPLDCLPKNCSQLGFSVPCPNYGPYKKCPVAPGCICNDGYLRNDKGICVLKKQCPKCAGDPNAESGCGNCQKTCSNYNNTKPQICNESCDLNGCNCKKGFILDEYTKKCVRPEDCTCKGDVNAKPGCGQNCGRRCSDYDQGPVGCAAVCEINGCDCKNGYVYDDNINKCVLPEKCTPVCRQNEEFTLCVNGAGCYGIQNCSQITCESAEDTGSCIDPDKCIPGCICKDGFLWNDNGVCVDEDECSLNDRCSGKPNEYWDTCPPMCFSETCAGIGKLAHCPPQAAVCRPRCRCAPGFYRNYKGVCVERKQCPENPCKDNEVYDECPGKCPPRVCGIDDRLIDCAPQPLPGDPKCPPPACRCADGFYRDDKGKCVKWEKCPKCPIHEIFDPCPSPCPGQSCSVDERLIKCAAPPKIGDPACKPSCRCEDGYKRNDKGVCVPKDQCPHICRGENETYDPCPSCDPNTCESIGKIFDCPVKPCKGACRCKAGFYRDRRGKCISKENCLKCNKPNEYYDCGGACDNVCATLSQQNQTNCPIINFKCNEMCYCDEGYARNRQGFCIPIATCPPKNPCKDNEVYDECPGKCPPRVCGIDNRSIDCAPQPLPRDPNCSPPACRCADGFYRNDKGKCIKWDKCPKCPIHEIFDPCPNPCPGQSCSVDERIIRCAAPPQVGDPACRPGCRCEDGYKRTDQGVCVPKHQCPPKNPCKDNEVYDECPGKCPPRVCGIDDRLIDCAPQPLPGDPKCPPPACRCADGFYRDDKGKCVKWEKCPKCPIHEIFDPCPNPCPGQSCSVDERLIRCAAPPQVGDPACRPGCRCEDGYKRNDRGVCVPKHQCPHICRGENESYDPCPSPCDPNTCGSIGIKFSCLLKPNEPCKGACRCKAGFYRDRRGKCISKENCLKCNKPNEYYACGGACDNVCATLSQQNQTSCPIINVRCNDMCYCDEGYARNRQGFCVLIPTCRCKGQHEWYDTCPSNCASDKCETYKKVYSCPLQITNDTSHCKPACRCENNFLRDKNGICIPEEQCPCNGDPNAKPGCGCSQTCSDYCANRPPRCTKICKINACDCKAGYVLEEKSGKCILPINCPGYQNPPTTPRPTNGTSIQKAVQAISRGVNIFAFNFLKQVFKLLSGQNFIVSPLSCQIALSQLAMNGQDNTLKQLLAALSLSSNDQIRIGFKKFLESTKSGDGATFTKVNKPFVNRNYPLKESFIIDTRDIFNGTAENINCDDPFGTTNYINEWVASETNGRIPYLLSPDLINRLTRLILTNAVYFQAKWKVEFNKADTKLSNFYTSDNKTEQVYMMNIETRLEYAYSEILQAQLVRIPYKNPNYTCVIILPSFKDGLPQTVANLNADTMKTALNDLYSVKVNLTLPSMELNTNLDLVEIVKALGVTDIFDPYKAKFGGILKDDEDLYVTAFLQKAYVEVKEEGTEAAAATGVVVATFSLPISPPPVVQVRADHPFVFSILGTGNILFLGVFNGRV